MYNNILVAVDPAHDGRQDTALSAARQLADNANSQITALSVVEPLPSYVMNSTVEDAVANADNMTMAALRKAIGARSEIKTVIRHGKAANEILEYADEHGIDCIVVASHRPGLTDYLIGSTAARVVRHAKCTVHVLR